MLRDFQNALTAKIRKALRVDLDSAKDKREFDWLENKVGPLYMAYGGYLSRLDPDHVIQLVCYNISLYLVVTVFVILFICTLMFEQVETTSLSVLFSFTMLIFLFLIFHFELFLRRLEFMSILNKIITLLEFKRRPKNQFEEKLFKVIRVYWGSLVWTPWICFMVAIPVSDYMLKGRAYSLPFPLWFPFKTNNPLGYAAAYVFELYAVHFLCSFAIAGVPLFIAICYSILKVYDSLIDSIRSMHDDALAMYKLQLGESTNVSTDPATDEEYFELYKDRVFQSCCERCLRQINIWHLQISRLINDMNTRISLIVTLTLTITYLAIGAAFCVAVMDTVDMTLKVTFTATGIMELLFIWIICHSSQTIIIKGEKVREELYFTNWYHWPEGMKRSLRIMLVRSLYPPHFSTALLDIKADYITFAAVVNSIYSFVNLVYALTQ